MELAYLAAFGCALSYGLGSLLQDVAAKRAISDRSGATGARAMVRVATQLPYIAGTALDGLGWGLSLLALTRLPLFAVEAISAASIGVVVIGERFMRTSQPNRRQWVMLATLGVGLLALAVSAQPEQATAVQAGFVLAMWAAVPLLVFAAWVLSAHTSGNLAAGLLGALGGVAFGGTAICARAIELHHGWWAVVSEPLTWAVVAYGALGLVLFAGALQRGTVTVALSCMYATQTVVPAIVGLLVLGDRSRPGQAGVAVVGFVLTTVAAVGLALVSPGVEPVFEVGGTDAKEAIPEVPGNGL